MLPASASDSGCQRRQLRSISSETGDRMSLTRERAAVIVAAATLGIGTAASTLQSVVDQRFVGIWVEVQGEYVTDYYELSSDGTGAVPGYSGRPVECRWRVSGNSLVLEFGDNTLESMVKYAYFRVARPSISPSGVICYDIISINRDELRIRSTNRIWPAFVPPVHTLRRDKDGNLMRRLESQKKKD